MPHFQFLHSNGRERLQDLRHTFLRLFSNNIHSGWYAQPFMLLVMMLLVLILLVLVLLVLVLLVLMGLKYIEKSSITKVIF